MDMWLKMVERLIEAGLSEDEAIEAVSRLLVLAGADLGDDGAEAVAA